MALQMIDASFDARPSPLPETNMIFANRPVTVDDLLGLRVSPQGKIIMDLHRHPEWWSWIVGEIGERNAENFRAPGDGNMDTNEPGSDELKLMSAVYGGGMVEVLNEFNQLGTTWCVIRTLDFNSPPERRTDGWHYQGEKLTYGTHPHLFAVRTNRKKTSVQTWLTEGGINIVNDVGLQGGKGHEKWPLIANKKAAQRKLDLWYYPAEPFDTQIYKNSLVIEGEKAVTQTGGISAQITKLRFHGPDVYGFDSRSGAWYKLSEMLVRGTLENRDGGTGFDWRLYAQVFLDRRAVSAPDCGWIRR